MANLAEKIPGRLFRDLIQRPESSEITGYATYLEKYKAFNFEFDANVLPVSFGILIFSLFGEIFLNFFDIKYEIDKK